MVRQTGSLHAGTRASDIALVTAFLLVICLPLAANLAGVDGGDQQAENRELAAMPHVDGSWRSVVAFPAGAGRWFEDHFGFRAMLVRWYGESRLFGLGVSPSSTVIRGKDGWLFYADDGAVEDYTNRSPLSEEELELWRGAIVRARDWLGARHIAFVFTIAPDKHAIYPEEMPSTIRRVGSVARTDQVFDTLARAGIPAVDVRPAVLAAKMHERVYEQTDTHWNDRGAFIAYQELIAAAREQLPTVPPAWGRSDFEAVERVTNGKDLAGMIGLTRVLQEHDLVLEPRRARLARTIDPPGAQSTDELGRIVTEIPGSRLPRAVVFRDSFFSALAPFLAEHFSRMVVLWQNDFDADVVLQEHPDIVIQEIVGRHLYEFLPSPDLVPK